MKRNWDTVREILVAAEELPAGNALTTISFPAERLSEITYHIEILTEAGIIQAAISSELGGGTPHFHVWRLTWEGHEFLDSIRNDNMWNRTKSFITDKGASMSFDVIKNVALSFTNEALGL
jgi:hypothetical protein